MNTDRPKRNHLHTQGKLEWDLRQKLIYLEPKGASDRMLFYFPHTIEKAFKDISVTKDRYNTEREKIRKGLNTPIRTTVDPNFLNTNKSNTRKLTPSGTSPTIILRSNRLKPRSPTPLRTISPLRSEKIKEIESLIENCKETNNSTKKIIKKLPKTSKILNAKFESIAKTISHIQESQSESIFFKNKLLKLKTSLNTSRAL